MQAPSPPPRPPPPNTLRLQYSSTMYTWSRSAKCPWKATMLRCRRRLCRAISRSTCRHSPMCTHPARSIHTHRHPPGPPGRDLSGNPLGAWGPWALMGGPHLPKRAQTPDSGPPARHHLESKHSAGGHVRQLIAAAEGTLHGGIHTLSE